MCEYRVGVGVSLINKLLRIILSLIQFVTTLPRTHYLGVDVSKGLTSSHMASHPQVCLIIRLTYRAFRIILDYLKALRPKYSHNTLKTIFFSAYKFLISLLKFLKLFILIKRGRFRCLI